MMLGSSARCGHMKCFYGVYSQHQINNWAIQNFAKCNQRVCVRNYAKGGKDPHGCHGCCKDIEKTSSTRVEPWPRPDTTPVPWRNECPQGPPPPNYDPYRIKVPDIEVPPLPPSNAKCGVLAYQRQPGSFGQEEQNPGFGDQYPQQQYDEHGNPLPADDSSGGLFGKIKGFFKRKKKTHDEYPYTQIVSYPPMLKCRVGPCGVLAPRPPPCPQPPPKPFSWIPFILFGAVMSAIGLAYKAYLYYDDLVTGEVRSNKWHPRPVIRRPRYSADLPACVQYLIIGGGSAAWAGYLAIKQHDKKAKVLMLYKEDSLPYQRPPMSKHMWWNSSPPDMTTLQYRSLKQWFTMFFAECKHFMDPVKFYRLKRGPAISIASGYCVDRIDADEHVAWIATNCGVVPIYYERCLFAPGAKPRNLTALKTAPKNVREKATTFRTIRDLENAYRKVRESKHVTIIGGGPLGTELAYYIGRMPKEMYPPLDEAELRTYEAPKISHVYKGKGVLSSIIPEYLSEWAAEKLKCENVQMIPNAEVYDAYESKDGRLELALSNGQKIVTDFAIVAIGTAPRDEIARRSFLELDPVNGGYLVNTELEARTHLYIAGDAASFYSQWKNTRMRVEHVATAEEQGYIAGANMTGYWTPCNMEPSYWVKLEDDLQVEVIGEVGASMSTIGLFKPCEPMDPIQDKYEKLIGEDQRPCYQESSEWKNRYRRGIVFYLRDETVVGMVFWNFPPIEDRKAVATELLRARVSYHEVGLLAELLGFKDLQCVYVPKEFTEKSNCITNSKWLDPLYLKMATKTDSEIDPSLIKIITIDKEEDEEDEEEGGGDSLAKMKIKN